MTKTTTVKTALAAVTLAAATFALPATAQAGNSYNKNCSDTENAVLGGVVGGSLGTVIGEEIAGRGDKTEGAILGAIIGGIAGAAIGDGANDCEKNKPRYRTTNHYPATTTYGTRNSGYQTVGHRSGRHTSHNGYQRTRGYSSRGYNSDPLYRIDREIERVRFEGEQLEREIRYSRGYRPDLHRRLDENGYRLKQLKKERKRIKKYGNSRNDYYRPTTTRRGHYHGSSRNLCYSDH